MPQPLALDKRTQEELPTCLDTYILLYEDAVIECFLNHAKRLATEDHSGFVILQISELARLKGLEQYYRGELSEHQSEEFFPERNPEENIRIERHGRLLAQYPLR